MAQVTYPWNPFQDNPTNNIPAEPVSVAAGNNPVFIPRAAPFFEQDFVITNTATNTPLVEGKDYVFAYPFLEFIQQKSKLAYGGVILLGAVGALQLKIKYATIGGDFVLDDIAYATVVGNVLSKPRSSTWSNITNLPVAGFPADPHDHPISQVINGADVITAMVNLVAAMNNETNNPTVQTQLVNHASKSLSAAHGGGVPGDVGLDKVKNFSMATVNDLSGNSEALMMSVQTTRLMIKSLLADALGDYDGSDVPGMASVITTGFNSLAPVNASVGPTVTDTQERILFGNGIMLLFGVGQLTTGATLQGVPGVAQAYEANVGVSFKWPFDTTPYVFPINYDGINSTNEYVNVGAVSTTQFSVNGGANLANKRLPFNWFAVGKIASS